MDKKNNVFREKSLERISSPERLDDYIKVSNPSIWVIILAMFILIGSFCYWGFTGNLPTTVKGSGVSVKVGSNDVVDTVWCYLSQESYSQIASTINDAGKDISNIPVKVTPQGVASKYGYITGKISSVGDSALSTEAVAGQLGDDFIAKSIMPSTGYGILVSIKLDRDSQSPKKLSWSGDNSDGGATLLSDTVCDVSIIVQQETPASFLFG